MLFVGYQAEGTAGRRTQKAGERRGRVHVDGDDVVVRARIETLRGLSAHADRGELRAWLRRIPDVRRVALHHGEVDAQESLAAFVRAP